MCWVFLDTSGIASLDLGELTKCYCSMNGEPAKQLTSAVNIDKEGIFSPECGMGKHIDWRAVNMVLWELFYVLSYCPEEQ